jgi:signal transduction histidine kinase
MIFEKLNPKFQALFPGRKLLGRPFLEALPEFEGQPFLAIYRQVLETGVPYQGHEVLARHKSAEEGPLEDHYYDFVYVRIDDDEGRPYGVYNHAIDVTERVQARRALENESRRLEASLAELSEEREVKDRFVATLTHDLRTPLTAAKLSAQLLARQAPGSPEVQQAVFRIQSHLDRADEMIRDLLDASRIRAGEGLPLEKELCDLGRLAADTLVVLGTMHGDRFVLRTDGNLEGRFSSNGVRRVLENLCNNAVKYGSPHYPIEVALSGENDWVSLCVRNQGTPIPEADQVKLFSPFHRTTLALTGGQRGWGLGLTLVRGIAEAHGGWARLTGSDETGTSFCVRLPKGRVE